MKDVTLSFQTPKLEPAPRSGVWLWRRHHGTDRAFFHRDGSQRIYWADCEHRLAGRARPTPMTKEQENPDAPSRQSRPLDVLLRWGDPPGIIADVVERFSIGLAIVSLVRDARHVRRRGGQ